MNRAVLYLRSSKDRADVSIDAQRRQLTDLAKERNLVIVGEYADAVESGKDEDRPSFQRLYRDLRARDRAWNYVIMLDTSRLARRMDIALHFEEREALPRGVTVVYKSLPDIDPVYRQLFKRQLQAMDEFHSMVSRQKGLAGMAENVRQGHRAGGRAPFGYRLVHTATGATRDGAAVTKSRLEPTEAAGRIGEYLRDRAAGVPRLRAREKAGLQLRDTTLIGIEWNALTYAGNTVWNVHAERVRGGYVGGRKRRPRAAWIVKPDTHPAVITKVEAEAILARLEAASRTRARPAEHVYLLSGILFTPRGDAWHGDRGNYRAGKGRKVDAERLEVAVLDGLAAWLQSEEMVQDLMRRMRAMQAEDASGDEVKRLDGGIRDLTRNIERVSGLLVETTAPQALLRSIEAWEAERTAMMNRKGELEERARGADELKNLRAADVRRLLKHLAADLLEQDRPDLKDALPGLVERVELDPETFGCKVRITPLKRRDKLASPRVSAAIPPFEGVIAVAPNRSYQRRAA